MRRHTLADMHALAQARGGRCLSEAYRGVNEKHQWECALGHTWEAIPESIKRDSWCPICAGNTRGTLEEIQRLAAARGGICLSDTYRNSSTKLRFVCREGHQFESCRGYLKAGNWCPSCAGKGKTLADLQAIATQRGGRCLSPSFLGMKKKHRWECAEGHTWEAIPQNITSGEQWCPICGRAKSDRNRRRYTIADMQALAQARGGQCLSPQFESVIKKLTWQCTEGHIWEATPHSIQGGTWCERCARKVRWANRERHTLAEMQVFATSKGGQCLSPIFVQVKAPLHWECAEGHRWTANADNVVNGGKWCPTCAGITPKTLEDMHALAAERGGKCVSTLYQGVNKPLQWECAEGHQWETIPAVIRRGGWCPICSSGLGERICRAFFEQPLETPFKKARPQWLRTPEGKQMELDGYSQTLHLAFEHQGLQHYKRIKHFHASEAALLRIQQRDQHKQNLCAVHEVTLIVVPSILDILGIEGIKPFLKKQFTERGIPIPTGFDEKHVDLSDVYCPNRLRELQAIATQRRGKLLSVKYLGIFLPLEWECAKGHRFTAAPNNIKNSGSWCPRCQGRGKTIQDMRTLAAERGGKCLSEVYVNNSTPLLWECREGHQWYARPSNVVFGTWCHKCAHKRRGQQRRPRRGQQLVLL